MKSKYLVFSKVLFVSFLFLTGACISSPINSSGITTEEATSKSSEEENAFYIARSACGSFHITEIESPNNIQATLVTLEKAKTLLSNNQNDFSQPVNSKVWFVQLTGKWQITGGPVASEETQNNPNAPMPTPEILNMCEVIIDANNGQAFHVNQFTR